MYIHLNDGCIAGSWECHGTQRPWRGLEWGWHLWSHHNKANPRCQAHEKSSGSTHDYCLSSLWSLCGRILPRPSWSEGSMCRSSTAAWPKLCSTPTTRDVEGATKHASYHWFPKGTEHDGWVWQEEGSTECTLQICAEVHEDGFTHIHIHLCYPWCLWELHLSSLDALCKYFFARDKQKYARLVPLYLAEMATLHVTDTDIHQEFMDGNFAINKNQIPYSVPLGRIMHLSTSTASWK